MLTILKMCLLVICLLPAVGHAIQVPGLYEIEVAVADQSDKVRQQALQAAFRLVLIKLTGDRQAAARTAVQPLLTQAQNYLQQYRYREVSKVEEGATGEPSVVMETRLWVKFDEDNLNQALRNLSVPVWGRERPSTLIWLAVEDEGGRRLVGPEDGAKYVEPIDKRAAQRGITILYPLLDLDDASMLRASDVWGGFSQPVFAASERYQADAILTGIIESPAAGIWEARWTVYIDRQMASWTNESDLMEAVLDEGIDNLADILATQFARPTVFAGVNQVKVSVADIFTVDHYARVLHYLSSLNSVSDVEVMQVEKGKVTFILEVHGGELAVSQAIELGRVLEAISANRAEYRLLP